MKKLLIAASFLALTSQAFASQSSSPRAIYNSLGVNESIRPIGLPIVAMSYKKVVGGLTCERRFIARDARDRSDFSCSMDEANINAQAIYDALGVVAVPINGGIVGAKHSQKRVGDLTCTRIIGVYPGAQPSYKCKFSV